MKIKDKKALLELGGVYLDANIKKGKKEIYDENDTHTLVIDTTGCWKTRKLILPTIWELAKAGESMVINDIKGELLLYTKKYLEKQNYEISIFNMYEPPKGLRWNMIETVNQAVKDKNISLAIKEARSIANAIVPQQQSKNDSPVWTNGEKSVIAATIILISMEADFERLWEE